MTRPNLPSRKTLEKTIEIINSFRDMCRHQMDLGYWGTVDFPSKHHINNILQLQYRPPNELNDVYGFSLADTALALIPVCKSYVSFLREDHGNMAKKGK